MITEYEFDAANVNGDKEAVIVPNTPTPVNKLSANETNGIKDKINEIVEIVNTITPILYPELRLLFKAEGNTLTGLQVGDIVHGFADASTVWSKARYEGGDVNDRDNYTPLDGTFYERFAPAGQVCTIPEGATAISATLDGYPQYKEQAGFLSDLNTFTQTGDAITFKTDLDSNSQILITYKL